MVTRTCIQCGKFTTHHHKWCEDHYPQKTSTILFLKKRLKEEQKKVYTLEQTNLQIRRNKNKLKKEIKCLKKELQEYTRSKE